MHSSIYIGRIVTAEKSMNSTCFKSYTHSETVNSESASGCESSTIHHISLNSVLESISQGVFIVNKDLLITAFNRAAEEITGTPRKNAIGQRCFKIFRSNLCGKNCVMQKTLATSTPMLNRYALIINSDKDYVPVNVSTTLLRDRNNEVVGGVETFQDLRLIAQPPRTSKNQVQFDELITRNPVMGQIIKSLPLLAASEDNVLIEGEAGTGKEMLARAIHGYSCRRKKPFISLNCGAFEEPLLDTELFGNQSRISNGQHKDRPGCFTLAMESTLFLSELSKIGKVTQERLLRILQEKTYEHQGSINLMNPNVRVIATTQRNISDLVKQASFCRDLYFQINVVTINMPPLRKRREDIPLLIDHFISYCNQREHKSIKGVSQEALTLLMSYNFPGNIIELKNITEQAFARCTDGYLLPSQLPEKVQKNDPVEIKPFGMEIAVKSIEAQAIISALKRNNFNRMAAARDLGIHKSTLFRKIHHLGIVLPQIDGRFRRSNENDNVL